jgi:hypothetical protein
LQQAEIVDFRGAFRPGLKKLLGLLDSPAATTRTAPRFARVPPWIAVMTVLLASVFLVPMAIFGDWRGLGFTNESIGLRIFTVIMLPVFFGFIIWHSCIAFLRRRMGLTRLTWTLTVFTAIFGFYLLGRTGWIAAVTARTSAVQYNVIPTSVLLAIVLTGCSALAIVLLVRPEDLLRWCPTGKAWDSYRRGRVMKVPDLPTRLKAVRRFHLLYDLEDAPAAARFRADLLDLGAAEAANSESDATEVILLTNRSTTAWLGQQTERMQQSVVTVVGSAIGLPPTLSSLWRRQWIDLRRWDAQHKRKNAVPAVPEGMARLRLPAAVRATEHLLCAIAGLMAVLANVVFPPNASNNEPLTPRDAFGFLIAVNCIIWIVVAWKLIHRTITQPRFSQRIRILSWLTPLLAAGSFYFFVSLGGNALRAIPAIIFVAGLPFLLARQIPRLAFWFPAPPAPGTRSVSRLNAPRKWDALLWAVLYMALWMLILGVDT